MEYVRPDGEVCEIVAERDWHVLLLAFACGGVPVGDDAPAADPLCRVTFTVRKVGPRQQEEKAAPDHGGAEHASNLTANRDATPETPIVVAGPGQVAGEMQVDGITGPASEHGGADHIPDLMDERGGTPEAAAAMDVIEEAPAERQAGDVAVPASEHGDIIDLTDEHDGSSEAATATVVVQGQGRGADGTAPARAADRIRDAGPDPDPTRDSDPDPDDHIRLGSIMRDFPEAKAFFNYLPGTDPHYTDRDYEHAIPGLNWGLRDYQLPAVWRALDIFRLSGGHSLLLADGMGLGKTVTSLAAAYLRYLLLVLWDDVEADREDGTPKRHLRASGDLWKQPDDAECPLGTYKHGVPCPCVERADGYRLVTEGGLAKGPIIMIVPPTLVRQTLQYIKRLFADNTPVPGAKPIEVWSGMTSSGNSTSKAARLPGVRYCEPQELRAAVRKGRGSLSGMGLIEAPDAPNDFRLTTSKELAHIVIVLPASSGLGTLREGSTVSGSFEKSGRQVKADFPVQPAVVIYDEMQKMKGHETVPWHFIQDVHDRSMEPVHFIGMSGTPMKQGFADLSSFFRVGRFKAYRHWGHLRPKIDITAARSGFEKCAAENKWLMKNKDNKDYATRTAAFHVTCRDLLAPFTVRRLGHQDFGGRLITELPPAYLQEIKCLSPARLAGDIRDLTRQVQSARDEILQQDLARWEANPRRRDEDKPTRDSVTSKMGGPTGGSGVAFFFLNLLATLPGILPWAREEGHKYELPAEARDRLPKTEGAELDTVTGGSAKLSELARIVQEMLLDSTPHKRLPPERQSLRKKMIVFVRTPCLGPPIAAFLSMKFPRIVTTWAGSELSLGKRDEMFAPFKRVTYEFAEEDEKDDDPRILVTTTGIAAEGHNFQRANYCVVLESTRFADEEKQALARIHRDGQLAESVYQYRLICEDNAAEAIISSRREQRAELTGDVLDICPRTDQQA